MRRWTTCAPAFSPGLQATCAFVALVGLAGCTTSPPPPPPPLAGSVVMDWTISESKDPGQCQVGGATTFHVSLYDSAGGFAGEWVQDCSALATTIDGLAPDTYTGQADLLDANGQPRTTQVNLQPFDVVGDATVTVPIDFPSNSFY